MGEEAAALASEVPTARQWAALAVLASGLGMIVLDGTIVGVALPRIIADLKLNLTDAEWINSLYAVLLASLLLSTGNLADRWGRRRLFQWGMIIFVAGSVLAAATSTAGVLLAARAVQAVGAACIMPSTLSTVNAIFRGKYRAAAFGVWGAVISGAAAIGPLVGGALTQYATWRWIFWVNVPIGAILLLATHFTVPETRTEGLVAGADPLGVILSAAGLGSLVFAIVEGPDLGWWSPIRELHILGTTWGTGAPISPIPGFFLLSASALTAFVFWEGRQNRLSRPSILQLSLFELPTFSWGNLTAAMVAVGEFAILFVLPLYLINARGLGVRDAGMVLAAMAAGAFLSGAMARHLAARFGSSGTVVLGLILEVVGTIILAIIISPVLSGWVIAIPLAVYGLGLGLASAQLTGTVLRDVPVDISGEASATQSTVRQVGAAFGTAFSGGALAIAISIAVPHALSGAGIVGEQVVELTRVTRSSAGTNILQMRADQGAEAVTDALVQGFTNATSWALITGAAFLTLGLVAALSLRKEAEESGFPQ